MSFADFFKSVGEGLVTGIKEPFVRTEEEMKSIEILKEKNRIRNQAKTTDSWAIGTEYYDFNPVKTYKKDEPTYIATTNSNQNLEGYMLIGLVLMVVAIFKG